MTRLSNRTYLGVALCGLLALWGTSSTLACNAKPPSDEHGAEEHDDHEESGHEEAGHDEHGHEEEGEEHAEEGVDEHGHAEHGLEVLIDAAELAEHGIEVALAGPGVIAAELEVSGEVALNADRVAHVVPRTGGVLTRIDGTLGEVVGSGQVLAVVQSPELGEAKSAYRAALGRRDLARDRFERESLLRDKGITPEQDYLEAKQALAEAELDLQLAEQRLHALGISEKQIAALATGHGADETSVVVTAPIGGTILEKHASRGEVVEAGDELYFLADLSEVWVQLTIQQTDLAVVQPGMPVTLASQSGERASGTIDFISGLVEGATRSAAARVRLPNVDGQWRPGQFVTAWIATEESSADLVVPTGAIQTLEGGPHVFVQTDEGFAAHPVKLGRASADMVEIVEGLNAGQTIAVSGTFVLKAEIGKGEAGHDH